MSLSHLQHGSGSPRSHLCPTGALGFPPPLAQPSLLPLLTLDSNFGPNGLENTGVCIDWFNLILVD